MFRDAMEWEKSLSKVALGRLAGLGLSGNRNLGWSPDLLLFARIALVPSST